MQNFISSLETPTSQLRFYVNNDYKCLDNVDPKTTLLVYLRNNGYVGAKYGCGEGGCGACCVVVAEFNSATNQVRYRTANSCLMPLCAVFGKQIITVEGIGCPNNPHPIQERFAKGNASQCGFCTPGFVMSLYGLLKINPDPSIGDIEEAFDGNLCRCTGYRSIIESARSFVKKNKCGENESSCSGHEHPKLLVEFDKFKDYDPKNDPQFPSELTKYDSNLSVFITNESSIWFRPGSLDELLKTKEIWPEAKLIGGNSEVGVEMSLRPLNQPNVFVYVGDLKELRDVIINENVLDIGVNITLTELIHSMDELKNDLKPHHKSLFNAFLSNLRWFASRHIRNFATLAGNITTGSPISDLNPILVATDALLTVRSNKNGERTIKMREFFLAYRKVNLNPDEVLIKVSIPLPSSEYERIYAYKQAKRKSDDIALVNGCYRVKLNNRFEIEQLDVSLGGVSPKTIYLNKLSEVSRGMVWGNPDTLKRIEEIILDEVKIDYSAPGAHPTYRRTLVLSFFTRFWYQVIKELGINENKEDKNLKNIDEIEREISSSSQDVFSSNDEPHLGATTPHVAALLHTTGTASYVDDMIKQGGELYAWPVMSTKAHAFILSIDESKALALKGVHAFITHKDVPNSNIWGLGKDEEYLVSKEVLYHGQLIGLVVADNVSLAKLGASLIDIKYQELEAIITIDDAIKANSFHSETKTFSKGTINEDTFRINADNDELIHEGTFHIGGQEHFYLETHSCLVIPQRESNEIEIYVTTQNPEDSQHSASEALGVDKNRITVRCKRLGGGFGGKETRVPSIAIPCAVAANKLNKPVRCVFDRDVDIAISGKRHPFKASYKCRVSRQGLVKAYDLDLVCNGGYSLDVSQWVINQAMIHADCAYNFPNIRATGKIAKTNTTSNTSFRGFGNPQILATTEMMLTEVAEKLGIDQVKIRSLNMYKPNETSFSGLRLTDWYLPEMYEQLIVDFDLETKRNEIEKFNSENSWKKRGIAIVPMKYEIGFGIKYACQGSAVCHIYTDGSVLIHPAGVEMGQGLYTKLIHLAANTLRIPESQIYIKEISTSTVPNGISTAASVATDLQGGAVINACEILYERLAPYREKNPHGSLKDWASAAFFDRVCLSAVGYHKSPDNLFDSYESSGPKYEYCTLGVSASIVELDLLTGDHTILRSDVFMDVGRSINYSVDVGQVEGAFVQGIGLFTIEDLLYVSASGALATKGPGAYKIPTTADIPQEFNVKFLKDKEYTNMRNSKKWKGIGEPPLQLALSVFLALRDAVLNARRANGLGNVPFTFNSPATCQSLRLAIDDRLVDISKVLPENEPNDKLFYTRP